MSALRLSTVAGPPELCAGAPMQLRVTADLVGEPPLHTWAHGEEQKGRLDFEDLRLSTSHGKLKAEDGTIVVPNTGLDLLGRDVVVEVSSTHAPGQTGRLRLKPHFGCGVSLDFRGDHANPGTPGAAGRDGRDGRDEQSSPSYAKPGGHGVSGEPGGDGGQGGHGGHGRHVTVDIGKLRGPDDTVLVLVRIAGKNEGASRTVLVDPARGGGVVLDAGGGDGGQGGHGGIGGRGGSGGTGKPAGDGANGGPGGRGGSGGDGGDGGTVVVRYDAGHPDLQGVVQVHNPGGAGGARGSAGGGGSGGNAFSGGRQGESGSRGQEGAGAGRDGRDGPPAVPQAVPRGTLFPDAATLGLF